MKKQNKFIDFVSKQNYISELSIAEHIILGLNIALSLSFFIVQIAGLKLYDQGTTGLTFAASITSIFSVMAGAKQRILCPFLGVISSIMLVAIAGNKYLFGTMIMHGFNIIMQTITLIIGYRTSKNKVSIQPKQGKLGAIIVYVAVFAGLTAIFAGMEHFDWFYKFGSGGNQDAANPLYLRVFDSMSLMFTVAAAFPMFKKYDFVGGVYIVADIGIAATGATNGAIASDPTFQFEDGSMFVSGLAMLATCVLGIINGRRAIRNKA